MGEPLMMMMMVVRGCWCCGCCRYGSCIAVGLACAGSGSSEAVALLEPMLEDVADYVRQAAMIGLAMVYMQQSEVGRACRLDLPS